MDYTILQIVFGIFSASLGIFLITAFIAPPTNWSQRSKNLHASVSGGSSIVAVASGAVIVSFFILGRMPWMEIDGSDYASMVVKAEERHASLLEPIMQDGIVTYDEMYRFNDRVKSEEGLARKRTFQRRLATIASSDRSGS